MKRIKQSIVDNKQVWDISKTWINVIFSTVSIFGSFFYLNSIFNDRRNTIILISEESEKMAKKIKDELMEENPDYIYIDKDKIAKNLELIKQDAILSKKHHDDKFTD